MLFPIIAFKNNIIFNQNGEAYAIYKLSARPFRYLPKLRQESVLKQFEQMMWGYEGKGQLIFLCEEMRITEEEYLAATGAVYSQASIQHAKEVRQALTAGARSRRRYIALQLKTIDESDITTYIKEFLYELRDTVMRNFFGSDRWGITERKIKEALEAEDELYRRIHDMVDGRADFSDLDFIIRRNIKRVGVLPPPIPSRDGGIFTPAILSAFSDGSVLHEHLTHITVTNGAGESHYQAYITFADMPRQMTLTGNEWLAYLDLLEMPVDAVVHFEIIRPYKAKKMAANKRMYLREQISDALAGGEEASTDEEYAYVEGRYLEGKLAAGQPLARISTVLCTAATNEKEMRANARKLADTYSSFRAIRPAGDQLKCFYSFIPGSSPAAPVIACDPGFLAAAGANISLSLGDEKGFFIAWAGSQPVFWMPGFAARELNRSNAIFASGALGGGKSLLVKLLLDLAYMVGAYIFIIDPKNEYDVLNTLFPIKKYDLAPGGDLELNPFTLSKDPRRSIDIALDFLSIVLDVKDDVRRVVVSEAVNNVGQLPPEQRHMDACIKAFRQLADNNVHEQIRAEAFKCVLLLENVKKSSLGSMAFGREQTGVDIDRVTIINMRGLPLPSSAETLNKGQITESERLGLAMLFLAATIARETVLTLPKEIVKMQIFDEAWMLLGISEGWRMMDELIRMYARASNAIPVIITQNTSDIANLQGISNNISYIFNFMAQNRNEIRANLELLGIDPVEDEQKSREGKGSISGMFPELTPGYCIMRDAYKRIGRVYIDPRPRYLLKLFDTSPQRRNS